jgi:phage shock protein PspC (stress-responsive transcriptional regulator)/xanthosine utilization system XapX-like protein
MTTTPPDAPTGPSADEGPRVTRDEVRDLGKLRRSASDRKLAGVAGGLARHLDVDPLVLRVAFVVLTFFGGAGLILYGACWLLVPDEESGQAPVTLDERSRTVALLVVGALAVLALLGDTWGVFWFPWPLAIIAVLVLLLVTRKDRDQAPPGSGGAPYVPVHDEPGTAPAPTYAASPTYAGGTTYAAPVAAAPAPRPVRPRDPRRRGPVLFWFTLALIALGVGILGTVDVAGADVPDPAYPALAVGLIGVMLLVGSVYGRAGGLILLGLLTTLGLAGATAADHWDTAVQRTPVTAAEVDDVYDFGVGELRLDLTELRDPEALDGRTIRIDGGAGRIEVIVPDDLDVTVDAQLDGPGSVWLFGLQREGIEIRWDQRFDNGDVADLTIEAELGFGEIYVDQE